MSSPFIIIDEITNEIENLNTSLTTTINTINTNVNTANTNVAAIKTNTAANSTESSTGTLSQKLAYLINRRDRIVTPSSTNIKTLSSSGSKVIEENGMTSTEPIQLYSGSCYVKASGRYRAFCTASFSGTTKKNNAYNKLLMRVYVVRTNGTTSTQDNYFLNSISGELAETTKSIDFSVVDGDFVYVQVWGAPYTSYAECTGYVNNACTITWSNVKICGTVQELNGLTT